ncbi:hypothetical protein EDD17DRAFT_1640245 [Pisolithus thermaeus]|nr:hypothetical protein EDD17DRAFT_1640245 [Pisolithus thermaeus]
MSVTGDWTREKSSVHFLSLALVTTFLSRVGRVRGSPRDHKGTFPGQFPLPNRLATHSILQYGNSNNIGRSCGLAMRVDLSIIPFGHPLRFQTLSPC